MTVAATDRRPALPAYTPADVVISRDLAADEHLIWTGHPPRGLNIRERDWRHAIGGGILLAFDIALLGLVGGPVAVVFNGLNSGALAAGALDRLVFQPRRQRRTWYGFTAERLVVAELVRGEVEVRSTRLADVGIARLTERADGSGVIDLYRPARTWWERRWKRAGMPTGRLARLELAADARRVYDLIRTARSAVPEHNRIEANRPPSGVASAPRALP